MASSHRDGLKLLILIAVVLVVGADGSRSSLNSSKLRREHQDSNRNGWVDEIFEEFDKSFNGEIDEQQNVETRTNSGVIGPDGKRTEEGSNFEELDEMSRNMDEKAQKMDGMRVNPDRGDDSDAQSHVSSDKSQIEADAVALEEMLGKMRTMVKASLDRPVTPVTAENPLRSKAVPIYEFWDERKKEHTFHKGTAWGREEYKGVAFYAFATKEEGTEVIYDYYHKQNKDHSFRFGDDGPRDGEKRMYKQYWVFRTSVPGAEPVYEFWNEKDKDHTYHFDDAWPGEVKVGLAFYAFRNL